MEKMPYQLFLQMRHKSCNHEFYFGRFMLFFFHLIFCFSFPSLQRHVAYRTYQLYEIDCSFFHFGANMKVR